MADHTAIEWTDATWNPITGCAIASPGCTNCYAMRLAGTRLRNHPSREGLTRDSKAGPVWTGEVRFNEQWLTQPLKWSRPRMIFVCAHGDLFAEGVPDEWIDQVFAIMALAPQHTFQVLTKRASRMREYLHELIRARRRWEHIIRTTHKRTTVSPPPVLPNVWLGVSVEDQRRAAERLPDLVETPAAVRWVSAEPLIGGLDIRPWLSRLGWVVAGGESGPGARPMHVEWIRGMRDQCRAAGVPFLFKQWGEWVPQVGAVDGWTINDDPEISRIDHRDWEDGRWGEPYRPMWCDDIDDDTVSRVGKRRAGRRLDDVEHNEFPKIAA